MTGIGTMSGALGRIARIRRGPGPLLVVAAALASLALPARAAAGTYVVAQCDRAQPGYADARFDRTNGSYYEFTRGCSKRGGALRIGNIATAPAGADGLIRWMAPAGSGIVGVSAEASLRTDSGHRARLSFLDARGEQAGRIATGRDEPGGFNRYSQHLDGVGRAGFAAILLCGDARPCPESDQARAAVRNVRLTVRDRARPTLRPSGSLFGGGWLRGNATLAAAATDIGSGLAGIEVTANGRRLGLSKRLTCSVVAGGGAVASMSPCPRSSSIGTTVSTAAPPLHDGANAVRICARDYGSDPNLTCVRRRVLVDNTAPGAAFRARSDSDPELIAADVADADSGLARAGIAYRPLAGGPWRRLATHPVPGGIAGRIDSEAVPPGRYAFRIIAADRAGNVRVVDHGRGGRPMVLELPLLQRTRIHARVLALGHRVEYGARPRLRGRITARGKGPGRLPLVVVERFERGSRPLLRRHAVRSSADGSFSTRLAKGPSRRVSVRFAGTRRLAASRSRPRKLAVVGRVRMRLSRRRVRAGGRVRFRGRIGTAGARVPAPGKVVELQVREPHRSRWRTVGDALHSSRRGRVRASYRFGRFYRRPTRFAFRLKVTRQAGWPYRAPTHSRPQRLVIKPRR